MENKISSKNFKLIHIVLYLNIIKISFKNYFLSSAAKRILEDVDKRNYSALSHAVNGGRWPSKVGAISNFGFF